MKHDCCIYDYVNRLTAMHINNSRTKTGLALYILATHFSQGSEKSVAKYNSNLNSEQMTNLHQISFFFTEGTKHNVPRYNLMCI